MRAALEKDDVQSLKRTGQGGVRLRKPTKEKRQQSVLFDVEVLGMS